MLSVSLCRSFHTCSVFNDKSNSKALGAVIKQLNKENKALFGVLLKKKKGRGKAKVNNDSLPKPTVPNGCLENGKPDLASEVWWWKATGTPIYLRVKSHFQQKSQGKTDQQASEFNTGDQVLQTNGRLSTKRTEISSLTCGKGTDEIDEKGVVPLKMPDINVTAFPHEFGEKAHSRGVVPLKMPDIIIRNITTFPLQHKENISKLADKSVSSVNREEDKNIFSYPSVTKILSATMSESSKAALEKWKRNMILQLGEDGFASFQKDLLQQGRNFHGALQDFLSGTPAADLSLEPSTEGCWKSVAPVLSNVTDVVKLESHVVHPQLKYRGFIDCVAHYSGKPVLIEWKKSNRQKPYLENTFDAPLQLCAYLGAMNYDTNYELKAKGGLIVVAYTDGYPAHTFELNSSECNKYWKLWLERLKLYWESQNS